MSAATLNCSMGTVASRLNRGLLQDARKKYWECRDV